MAEKNIFFEAKRMLAEQYPEWLVIKSIEDLGVDTVSAKKIVVLIQSDALGSLKKDLEEITSQNISKKLAEIEKKLPKEGIGEELLNQMRRIEQSRDSDELLSKNLAKEGFVTAVSELLKQGASDNEIIEILAGLDFSRDSAKRLLDLAKERKAGGR